MRSVTTTRVFVPTQPRQAEVPQQTGEPFDLGNRWRWVPPGEFKMGPEFNRRTVTTRGFFLSSMLVSNGEWKDFLSKMGRDDTRRCSDLVAGYSQPAVWVEHGEAVEFARWLGASMRKRTGHPVIGRLPTSEEWERAAIGPYQDEFMSLATEYEAHINAWTTRNVNSREAYANSFGLRDMIGNVWEWTSSKSDMQHVVRGGSWRTEERSDRLRAADSHSLTFGGSADIGIRVLLEAQV